MASVILPHLEAASWEWTKHKVGSMLCVCSDRWCVGRRQRVRGSNRAVSQTAGHTPWHCHRSSFGESDDKGFFSCCSFSPGKWHLVKIIFPWWKNSISVMLWIFLFIWWWGGAVRKEREAVSCYTRNTNCKVVWGGMRFLDLYCHFYFVCMLLEAKITWHKNFHFIVHNTLIYLKSYLIVLFFASEILTSINPDLENWWFKIKINEKKKWNFPLRWISVLENVSSSLYCSSVEIIKWVLALYL